jgi:hypothetical protein
VIAIPHATESNSDLAYLYGVGISTIKGIRSGHRGRTFHRSPRPIADAISPEELSALMVKEITDLSIRYQRAMRRALARTRKQRTLAGQFR